MDVEFDAIGQNLSAFVIGVNGQQLGSQRPVAVQIMTVDEFGILPEFRISRLGLVGAGSRRTNREDRGQQGRSDGPEPVGALSCGERAHVFPSPLVNRHLKAIEDAMKT